MGNYNKQTFTKSFNSYRKSMNAMLEICPEIEFHGSGNPTSGVLLGNIEPSHWADKKSLIKHCDDIRVYQDSLFEYGGRPKLIDKNFWLFKSSFFKISFYINKQWKSYRKEYATVSLEGKTTPERISHQNNTLTLSCNYKEYGIGNWNKNYKEIYHLMDLSKKDLRDGYRKKVEEATEELKTWKRAIKDLTKILV